jgi:SAM-dependent methyltransferase
MTGLSVTAVGKLHRWLVYGRRARILANCLSDVLPRDARVLDVGCGDGSIDVVIQANGRNISILGIDVSVRPDAHVAVTKFDGTVIPFPENSFDIVMFVDVLHHMADPPTLLREAIRVARKAVVIKDHTLDGAFAYATLRFMDWVGNAQAGSAHQSCYWPEQRWRDVFDSLGLRVESWSSKLGLYPWPFSMVFERHLHFVARLALA